jgi:hypothetical protein
VRSAFERGYQKGRQDEAQMQASNGRSSGFNNSGQDRGGSNSNGDYRSGGSGFTR